MPGWLAHRFAWGPIREGFLDRRVPKTPWYYGDGSTLLLLLGVQVGTGAALALTYAPTPDTAYDSVAYITGQQVLGWFVRGLHYWSAGLMVVMLFFHLFRLILVGGYKTPREGTWLLGVLMFFVIQVMAFTGYTLRWDERGIHAVRVALHMFYRVPLVGEYLVLLVQGGPQMSAQTLTRLYAVHVFLVPLLLLGLAGYHLYLVIVRGITSPAERRQPVATAEEQEALYHREAESQEQGETFYPHTVAKSGAMGLAVLALAVVLTLILGPQQLEPEANLVEPARPQEEWWFWWYSGLIALLPPSVAPWFVVVFPILLFVALVSLPFVDRSPYRGIRKRPVWAGVVVLSIAALLFLSDYRRRSPFTGWPDPQPPPVPPGIELTASAERGRLLFARYGCNSCHPVAGHGPSVGPDFARSEQRLSKDELREFILQPAEDAAMPAFEGRMRDEELELVVEFCHVAQTFPRR